jgi:hypothetical protein
MAHRGAGDLHNGDDPAGRVVDRRPPRRGRERSGLRTWATSTPENVDSLTAAPLTGEGDTAWIAADRAAALAEATGDALAVAASMYRMAHVFLSLDQLGQAQQVAAATAAALELRAKASDSTAEARSPYGACQLVLAITAARENERASAYRHLDLARQIAEKSATAAMDYGTEFGPVNVAIYAVSVAVDPRRRRPRPRPRPRRRLPGPVT